MKTRITGHRGFREKYPENTLPSFQAAVERGAERIELDVHESSDGEIVVHHDYTLGRTNNGNGPIHEATWDELSMLDAGSWFSKEFAGTRIPLLSEVLSEFGPRIEYEIELKGLSMKFLEKVLSIVKDADLLSRVEFTSPHVPLLMRLREFDPNTRRGLFVHTFPNLNNVSQGCRNTIETLRVGEFSVAHLPTDRVIEEIVTQLRDAQVMIHAADCNTEVELKKAFDLQVDQLSTDRIDLALDLRSAII